MQLILPAGEALSQVQRDSRSDPGCKFAMFKRESGEHITHLFPYHLTHSQVVEHLTVQDSGLMFVGAGFVLNGAADWGSESCVK